MTTPSKKYSNEDLKKWKSEINAGPIIATRVNLRRENTEWVGLCPFHDEKTPSFKVYRDSDRVWLYKCFGCGKTGNVFQFVREFDKVSFTRAVEIVLEQAGTIDPNEVEAKPKSKKLITIPIAQYTQCERALESSAEGKAWIEARGITITTARRFHLGFVQDGTAFCDPDHPWKTKGWIAFPTLSVPGHCVYAIKYRSIVGKKETIDGKLWSGILRAPHMPTTLFNLREVNAPITTPDGDTVIEKTDLHNVFITEGEYDTDVFICEGEPDTLVLSQTGTPAVGLVSSVYRPREAECDALRRAKRRFLAGDNTPDGIKAMERLWKELGPNTYFLQWPGGIKDANEMLLQACLGSPTLFQSMLDDLKTEAVERGEWTEPEPKPEPKKESKKELATPLPPARMITHTAAQVKTKKLKWLWLDRVSANKITVYAGNPDNGKSLAATDLVARVTAGINFPDCVNTLEPSEVLMLLGEDDEDDTTIPRLMSAGADLDKVHFPEGIVRSNSANVAEVRLDFDRDALESFLKDHPAIRLIVIDPISSFLGDVNMIAEQSVRSVLTPLKTMAARYNAAVLLVMHLNKKSEQDAISRVGGAMAFTGVARSVWLFSRDASSEEGESKDSFSMCRLKNNLTAAKSGGLAYSVQARQIPIEGETEPDWVPYIIWGEKINKSADDSLGRTGSKREPGRPVGTDSDRQNAIAWLQDALRDGARWNQELKEEAKETHGIAWRTLERAKNELKVKARKDGKKWMWELSPVIDTAAAIEAAEVQGERADTDATPTPAEGESAAEMDRNFDLN